MTLSPFQALRRSGGLVAALVLLGTPALASTAAARHDTVLVGHGQSTERDRLGLLAGSTHWLVYTRSPVYTSGLPYSDAADPVGGTTKAIVRSKSGSSRVLAMPIKPGTTFGSFSLSGNWLVAGENVAPAAKAPVAWWNLNSGRHGTLRIPSDDTLLTAAPAGATYITRRGVVKIAKISGGTTILGRPFSAEPVDYYDNIETDGTSFTAADDQGIVLGGETGEVRYIAFDHPGTVRTLQSGANELMLCSAVSHDFAACPAENQDDDIPAVDSENLIPLDGGAPTSDADPHAFSQALSGDRLVWASRDLSSPQHPAHLRSLVAGSTTPVDGTAQVGGLASAFGEAIAADHTTTKLEAATDATHVTTLLTAPKSPPTVSAFALTAVRIVDVDDSAPSTTNLALRSRSISVKGAKISTGPTSVIARPQGSNLLDVSQVTASSGYTAYVTVATDPGVTQTLHVASKQGDRAIGPVVYSSEVALSEHRLLYVRQAPGKFYSQLVVRNLLSSHDTVVDARFGGNGASVAISGHFVSYITARGGVYRYDLSNGDRHRIAKPPTRIPEAGSRVFEQGPRVGWAYIVRAGRAFHVHSFLRNSPTSKVIALSGALIGLPSRGALLARNLNTVDLSAGNIVGSPARVQFRTSSGHTVTLLVKRRFVAAPQLVGATLAWVAADGSLRVTRLGS